MEIIPAGVQLGGGPRCWGMVLTDDRTKRTNHIECTAPATWRKVILHCGYRERLLCDEHHDIDLNIRTVCRVCGTAFMSGWEQI